MNHVYKIVFNKNTGGISVVSEKTSSHCQSHKVQVNQSQTRDIDRLASVPSKFIKKNLSLVISLLLGSLVSSISYSATTQMTYTGSQTLIPSSQLDGNFNFLIGDSTGTKQGLVVESGGIPISSDTELTVDYSTGTKPNFIVAGYTSNNVINFKNAEMIGNVYAGLSIKSETIANSNVRNLKLEGVNNIVSLSDDIKVNGDIYAGYMGTNVNIPDANDKNSNLSGTYNLGGNQINLSNNLIKIKNGNSSGNINSGIGELKLNTGNFVFNLIGVNYYGNNNSIKSINNVIEINGGLNNFKNINSGNSIIDFTIGDRIQINPDYASNYERTSLYSDNITLISNKNLINISGDNNNFNNISTGLSRIKYELGQTKNSSSIMENFSGLGVEVSSEENTVNLSGNSNNIENIFAGNSKFSFIFNDDQSFIALNTQDYSSTDQIIKINSNRNNVKVDGNNNILKDIYSGYSQFDFKTDKITTLNNNFASSSAFLNLNFINNLIYSNNNNIEINGINTIGGVNSGYSSINIDVDDIIASTYSNSGSVKYGDSWLIINVKNTQLLSNNNKVSLLGKSLISGNLISGYSNFYLDHGSIIDGYGNIGDEPLIYMGGIFSPKNASNMNLLDINGTKAFANNNTITIEGEHTFVQPDIQDPAFPNDPTKKIKGEYGSIYGGYLNYNKNKEYFIANADGTSSGNKTFFRPEVYDVFTGNILNYNNRTPITLKEIGNFQTYNFIIDSVLDDPNTPFITADTIILGSHESNMSDTSQGLRSDIHVTEIAGNKEIINNTKYILMQATNNLIENSHGTHLVESVAQQALSRVYDVDTYIEGNNVVAVIEGSPEDNGVETNPQLDALLLGNLSGLMLLTRNADTLSDNLFNAISEQNYQRGLTPFIITSGNHTKYETGHHSNIKSDGALTTIGLSWQDEQTTLGTFVENGWDSYTTFNGFTDVTNVSGKGHNRFNGIGLYGHYDFMNGWYADATVRGGRLHTAFETDDLRNVETDERAEYKLSTNYYGANLEGGYSITFNPKNTVNLKAKYLWAQTDSQDLTVASEQIHFNKLDSHRVQFHIENLNQLTPELTFISSLGYEHEFTGKAQGHASSYGFFEMDDQSVKGGTGISSIGVRYIPSQYKNLSIDAKATGYIGKREGGMGMLKVDYVF